MGNLCFQKNNQRNRRLSGCERVESARVYANPATLAASLGPDSSALSSSRQRSPVVAPVYRLFFRVVNVHG